jgi:hypothetical protein
MTDKFTNLFSSNFIVSNLVSKWLFSFLKMSLSFYSFAIFLSNCMHFYSTSFSFSSASTGASFYWGFCSSFSNCYCSYWSSISLILAVNFLISFYEKCDLLANSYSTYLWISMSLLRLVTCSDSLEFLKSNFSVYFD